MWNIIFESAALEKEIEQKILNGEFTSSERTIIQSWVRQMTFDGPESIQNNSLWNDHALEREWLGYRSSSFSNRGRIIYKVEESRIIIKIARITKTHNYDKKEKL